MNNFYSNKIAAVYPVIFYYASVNRINTQIYTENQSIREFIGMFLILSVEKKQQSKQSYICQKFIKESGHKVL